MAFIFGRRSPYGNQRRMGCNPRIIIAIGVALFSIISYYSYKEFNPFTGENQRISISAEPFFNSRSSARRFIAVIDR